MKIKITIESPNPGHFEALCETLRLDGYCFGGKIVELKIPEKESTEE